MVVLGLNQPGAPGHKILTRIRADARLAKTEVILATVNERQTKTLENITDLILLKPVNPTQLRDLASRFSRKSRKSRIIPPQAGDQ